MELLNQVLDQIKEIEAINLTRSLINIPSIVGNEKDIGDYLSKELVKLGVSVECVQATEGRPNIISRIKGETDEVGLILVGHTDTVPVGQGLGEPWKVDPFNGDLIDGCMYGLGSSDMKGGIASILMAVKAVLNVKVKLKKGITIVFCVDEESGSIEGMKYISEKKLIKGNLAMSAEPVNLCIQGWFKGRTWYEIEVKGRAAHSSAPSRGINAIHNMVDIISVIKNCGFKYKEHELLGDCTVSFGTIQGGTSVKSIPDLCKSRVEVRTVPGQTGEVVLQEINAYIRDLKNTNQFLDAKVRIMDGKDPMELSPQNPFFHVIQEASQQAIGRKLDLGRTGGAGGDLYFLWKNLGIPGINFGPGDMGYGHSPNERIEIIKIIEAAKCYAAFILKFCEGY